MFVCTQCGQPYEQGGYCPADGRPLAATDDRLIGTEIGRYRVSRLIGEGGMGRVYLGVQPMIGSRVAIKVLDDQCARNPDLLERFFSEARAVNLIRHESIVSVLDLAKLDDGRPYIVMEYIEGQTLGELVRGGAAPLGGVVQVMTEMLSGLAAAHAIGIVHRDLKPDNVLVTAEGHAKVLDFGIAKLGPGLAHPMSPRTRTGALLGTPAYMSPEQISGSGTVDARTDVYAAGIVLFEACTGRVPFEGETLFDLMRQHLEEPPPPPRSLRANLPPAFEQVILTALAKEPARRFPTAAEMADALHGAAGELPPEQWRALSSRGGMITGGRPSMLRPRTASSNAGTWPQGGGSPTAAQTPGARARQDSGGGSSSGARTGDRTRADGSSGARGDRTRADGSSGARTGGRGGSEEASSGRTPSPSVTVKHVTQDASRRPRTGLIVGALAAVTIAGGIAAIAVSRSGDDTRAEPSGRSDGSDTATTADGGSVTAPERVAASGSAVAPERLAAAGSANAGSASKGSASKGVAKVGLGSAARGSAAPDADGPTTIIIRSQQPAGVPRFTRPIDYDPKKFDGTAYAPKALALARGVFSDAQLTRFDINGVYPDGHADLTLPELHDTSYLFRSPSRSARPTNLPSNIPAEIYCYVEVTIGVTEIEVRAREMGPLDPDCRWALRPLPRCSLAEIWSRAKRAGAKPDTVAKIGFLSDGQWFFDNEFDGRGVTESYADACP